MTDSNVILSVNNQSIGTECVYLGRAEHFRVYRCDRNGRLKWNIQSGELTTLVEIKDITTGDIFNTDEYRIMELEGRAFVPWKGTSADMIIGITKRRKSFWQTWLQKWRG